jgi:septum formation topological specificity factor MinE
MNCDRCSTTIPEGEEREHNSRMLCEDCYMDALSPSVGCDPWANYIASKTMDSEAPEQLSDLQNNILDIIRSAGEITPDRIMKKLDGEITSQKLKNEMSTLRHMKLILGRNHEGTILFRYTAPDR